MADRRKSKPSSRKPPVTDPSDHDEGCRLLADFFSVFAHPIRMQLFCHLRNERYTVSELAQRVGITVQNASQQLRIMREKGVLVAEREGQSVYLSIADPRIVQAASLLREVWAAEIQRRATAMVPQFFAGGRTGGDPAAHPAGD